MPGESIQAYEALQIYLKQGAGRSLDSAYRESKGVQKGNAPGRWCQWSVQWYWVERAREWDNDRIARRRELEREESDRAYRERLRKYHERLEKVANQLINVAEDGLEKLHQAVKEMEPGELDPNRLAPNIKSIGDAIDKAGLMIERALGVEDVARGLDGLSVEEEDTGDGTNA